MSKIKKVLLTLIDYMPFLLMSILNMFLDYKWSSLITLGVVCLLWVKNFIFKRQGKIKIFPKVMDYGFMISFLTVSVLS